MAFIFFIEFLKNFNAMRIIKIVFMLLFGSSYLLAQQQPETMNRPRVQWSKEYEEPSNSNIQKVIGTEGGGFYALRIRQGGILGSGSMKALVEYYDNSMKLLRQKELDLEYKGKERFLKDVVLLQGKLWLLSYFYNEKHEKTYLFAQRINNQTLSLERTIVKISEQDATNKDRSDVFSYGISRDSSKIVVFTQQPSEKREQEFALTVFDSNFSKDALLPYNRKSFSVDEFQVDKNGNVFLLGVVYTEGSNRLERRGKPTYQYSLIAYMKDSTLDIQEYKIQLKDKFITELTFRVADDDDLVFSGFYSEKGATSMKGTCFFKINPKGKDMTSVSTREFDFNFVTENLSDRSVEKAKAAVRSNDKSREPELQSYSLDKLILRSDGGALLIAEQYYVDERRQNNYYGSPMSYGGYGSYSPFYSPYNSFYDPYGYRNNRNNRTDYYYNYNDIIVVNIRPDGEIAWTARIPKHQLSRNDEGIFSSYAMSIVADKLYFVYNEDPRNLDPNRKKNYTEEPDKYSVVVLAEVNKQGEVKRSPLFQNKEEGVVTRPKICRQIGRRDLAIYGERGRGYRFGLLSFEN
jgi:hypothetical protein